MKFYIAFSCLPAAAHALQYYNTVWPGVRERWGDSQPHSRLIAVPPAAVIIKTCPCRPTTAAGQGSAAVVSCLCLFPVCVPKVPLCFSSARIKSIVGQIKLLPATFEHLSVYTIIKDAQTILRLLLWVDLNTNRFIWTEEFANVLLLRTKLRSRIFVTHYSFLNYMEDK